MSQLTLLNLDDNYFPEVGSALSNPDGLLAVGGDLSTERLMNAYQRGIFPWFNAGDPLMWWSPSKRCIILCAEFNRNKTFTKFLRKTSFKVTLNKDFESVISHCRLPRKNESGTWIDDQMSAAYNQLHANKLAHSVEVWDNNDLVGGLYGVFINNTFCGESMFSLTANASKTALYALSVYLLKHKVTLIDCQIENPHLMSLGATIISRNDFMTHLSLNKTLENHIDWQTKELNFGEY